MKKRMLVLLLALVMTLSLLPFGASAAGPTKNGSAAFDLLMNAAKENGTQKGTIYQYEYKTENVSASTHTYSISYDSYYDSVSFNYKIFSGVAYYYSGYVSVPRDLVMPYSAGYNGQDRGSDNLDMVVADVDSAFNSSSVLRLRAIGDSDTSIVVNARLVDMLVKALTGAQEEFLDGTGYSVGDLGFTALADENGWTYSSESMEAEDTPKATGRAAEAYDYLKQRVLREKNNNTSVNSLSLLEDEDSGIRIRLYYDAERDKLTVSESYSNMNSGNMEGSSLVIPASVSMPYEASQNFGSVYTATKTQSYRAWVDSSFSSDSVLTLEQVTGVEEEKLPTYQEALKQSLKLMLLALQKSGFENSDYTIADLGFTTYALEIGAIDKIPDDQSGTEPTDDQGTKPTDKDDAKPTDKDDTKPADQGDSKNTEKPEVKNPFVDVEKDQYYFEPVLWAVNHDPQITKGVDDTHFQPNATCTRAQVVTFLWRAKNQPAPKTQANPYKDVSKTDYFYDAVLWAMENGITVGTSDSTFGPNEPCTRAHVVTFLWRADGKPAATGTNPFVDVPQGEYYTDAVLWAVSHEPQITKGTDDTHFDPNADCTRGQIVTFLYRDLNK